jgi:hypothetical protein
MTMQEAVTQEHYEDWTECCPEEGHWWLEDVQRAAVECRMAIEPYGWTVSDATWDKDHWLLTADCSWGHIEVNSDNLGACFFHMRKSLKDKGWLDEARRVKEVKAE